ncbi:hypothetical protein Q7P36_000905 [Cladosporium allicinum]
MEDIFQPEGFWIALYAIVLIPFLFWLYYPSRPLQDVSVAEHDNLPTFPPAPPRRPTPKYITLADLAKKNGWSEQTTAVANYPAPTRTFYTSPPVQRGRWEVLSAAAAPAAPAPPPAYHPEQYAAALVTFSAFLRSSAAEPPFVPPKGLQDALRPRAPPPFDFPRPKGPPSNWQGPAAYANNPLLPRPAPPPLPRAIDRWLPLLPKQRFNVAASRFTETAMGVPPLVSFAQSVRVEQRPSRHNFL